MRFYGSKSPTRTNPHPPRTQTNGDQWQIQDFPRGGAPTPKVGVLTYFFGQKLHENERIWTPGGSSLASPLDPPLVTVFVHTLKLNLLNCFNTVVKLNCFDTVVKLKIEI